MSAPLYPLFVSLQGRGCVVVGGNEMAEGKIRDLLDAEASIRVIAPVVNEQIAEWSQTGKVQWEARPYENGDLRDALLVVSVADAETNAKVFAEAEMRRILCNAVDDVKHCNCYASAVCVADHCRSLFLPPARVLLSQRGCVKNLKGGLARNMRYGSRGWANFEAVFLRTRELRAKAVAPSFTSKPVRPVLKPLEGHSRKRSPLRVQAQILTAVQSSLETGRCPDKVTAIA